MSDLADCIPPRPNAYESSTPSSDVDGSVRHREQRWERTTPSDGCSAIHRWDDRRRDADEPAVLDDHGPSSGGEDRSVITSDRPVCEPT